MAVALESNKTKIAKRVIEVFEFFAAEKREATVMDIVRRYERPQSSTSELLSALVEMGLLYKDAQSRSYRPTPRLATLGAASQPEPIASGRLFDYMERLAQTTRCGVGLFGIVGTHVQIFRWADAAAPARAGLACGASAPLSSSAVGLLLLSSLGLSQASRLLWRLNAEADEASRFDLADINQTVARCGQTGHVTGVSGFDPSLQVTAVLMPPEFGDRGLALGVAYEPGAAIDPEALIATLMHGARQCGWDDDAPEPFVRRLVM